MRISVERRSGPVRALVIVVTLVLASCAGRPERSVPREGYVGWEAYGGGPEQIRYSRLTQINRDNVSRLRVAWTYDTRDAFPGSEMQANPIVVDGVLYATSPQLKVIALDAASGRELWTYRPVVDAREIRGHVRNRGLMHWQSGRDSRVYVAARHLLFALDAKTGRPVGEFGDGGAIDLRAHLGRPPESLSVSLTTPGVVYKDLLIVGSIVSEGLPSAPGDIRAYDARTGGLRWSFRTIPHPGEPGYETWPPDAWKIVGGANAWAGLSLDAARGLVFVPTGSAAFDFYGGNRAGDNLYANSLLCLKADTGERVWHFQIVRHDVWDRDLPAPPSLVTVLRDGRRIDAVAQITKHGHVFVFDRVTGASLFPLEEIDVPASDIPGEVLARTQVVPLRPAAHARQRLWEDTLTSRTPEARRAVRERFRMLRNAGPFTPPSREGTIVFPGLDGGGEWGGAAYDPETGLFYVNANEMAWILRLTETQQAGGRATGHHLYQRYCAACHLDDFRGSPPEFPSLTAMATARSREEVLEVVINGRGRMPGFAHLGQEGAEAVTDFVRRVEDREVRKSTAEPSVFDLPFTHDGYNRFLDPDGYPAVSPPWGTLNAIDLDTGEFAWRIPFGEFPELVAQGVRNTGSENYGGPVVTAGGLLFIGATNHDRKFRAFDKLTGALLWETTLPDASGNATPAVYEIDGRQFVVIGAGGGKGGAPSGGKYVAFALPR